MPKKLTLEYVQREFKKVGYHVVSTSYTNNSIPIEFICEKGHKTKMTWSVFKQGCRCNVCFGTKRYDYDFVKSVFNESGYELLTREYKNNKQKLEYKCPKGHVGNISLGSFMKGQRCAHCYGNIKYTLEQAKAIFAENDFILLESVYYNSQTPMLYKCNKGHINKISLSNLKSGWGCPSCSGCKKKTITFIKSEFEKEGYTLLSKKYINSKTKLDYICPEGHRSAICWGDFKHGYRCIECAGKKKKTIEEVQEFFSSEGFELLTKTYKNNRQQLKYICPEGHEGATTWHDFYATGNRCLVCSGKKKKTYEEVKEMFEKEGYTLLSKEYVNSHSYLKYECPNGHIHKIRGYRFTQGGRCPVCSRGSVSKISQKWLDSLGIKAREHHIKELGVRVDGYDPKTNTVYEFLGDYWHGNPKVYPAEEINPTNKKPYGELHKEWLERKESLEKEGYKVKSIWESDFNNT